MPNPTPTIVDSRSDHRKLEREGLLLAAALGVIVGLAAVGFELSVKASEHFGQEKLGPYAREGFFQCALIILAGSIFGGLAGYVTAKFAPEAGGSGIPHVKAVLMNLRVMRPFRVIATKIGGGLAAIAAGMSLGREGPTIQIGAAVGSWLSRVGKVPERLRLSLIASGSGAGLAAAFNAPLAGFIFVMEELRREMSPLTYGLALIGSVSSVAVCRLILGQDPSFQLSAAQPVPLRALIVVVFLGIICGLVGVFFNALTMRLIALRERFLPRWIAGAIVGALAAGLLAFLPEVTGAGHHLTQSILIGRFSQQGVLGFLALILVAKILLTSTSFSTGVPGGIFAPLLVIGSVTGFIIGTLASGMFPSLGIRPDVFASLGMAAVLCGSVRAPLTGVVLIVEMTQQYTLLYALLVCAFVSYLTANLLRNQPVYEALLERELARTDDHGDLPTEATTLELIVEPDSLFDGKLLRDVSLPKGALITVIKRQGKYVPPQGDSQILYGDDLTILLVGAATKAELLELYEASRAPHPSVLESGLKSQD